MKDETIQIISNLQKTKHLYLSLVRAAQMEVLLIFPTTNAIRREEGVGVFNELRRAAERGVRIRVLTPEDEFVKPQLDVLRSIGINIRQIEYPTEAKFKLLIVDKRFSLVIETKNDRKGTFEQAVGLATFSNSKPTVLPYVTIFDSFWRETDLYEKAREADRIKDEFVNIAAHELRNPISPIIASSDFAIEEIKQLKEGKGGSEIMDSLTDNLNVIARNALKLYKLSEDILQVSRIESGTFALSIESVDFSAILALAIQDTKKKLKSERKNIEIQFDNRLSKYPDKEKFVLYCDSSKINQVLHNLLDNAIKFSYDGVITVSASIYNDSSIIIKIEDSGRGIDPAISNRLFEKFSTKSDRGTGLGLYIAKAIIEAHGGRIWGQNKPAGNGAIFAFTLPTDLRPTANQSHINTGTPEYFSDALVSEDNLQGAVTTRTDKPADKMASGEDNFAVQDARSTGSSISAR
jgi:signal transduction histidine kinase